MEKLDVGTLLIEFGIFLAQQPPPPRGKGPSPSRAFFITHNDAPQSVALYWTSDQLIAETST